jgi:Macrocin-O-methyltransferase (TylF)
MNPTTELYLDLLKKTLTGTLYGAEPNVDDPEVEQFIEGFLTHYIRGPAITMLPIGRLDNVQQCLTSVVADRIAGDVIETGVWRGGTTVFMRGVLKALGVTDRLVWVADSFEGLPAPDASKFPNEARAHGSAMMVRDFKHFAVGLEEVKLNFARFGLLDEQVVFLKGWFKDTLPRAPIERVAVARLDGDYYESTMDALTHLYPKVSVGGFIIIDDYGDDFWTYCRRAVDDFRRAHGISDRMINVDSKCCYWRRTA